MSGVDERDSDWYLSRGIVTDECLGHFLGTCAGFWPKRPMVSFGDAKYSYEDMHCWSLAAAHMLVEYGLKPGDRVMIQAVNSIEILVIQFAAWRVGAVTVPIVPMYRAHELKHIVTEIAPKYVVASGQVGSRNYSGELDDMLAEMGQTPALKIILNATAPPPGWIALVPPPAGGEAIDDLGLPEPAPGTDCAVILYTSGSTAAPKGAMLRSGAIVNNARTFSRSVGLGQNDASLCATPLGHTGALINGMIVPMSAGGRAHVLPSWKPDHAVAAIERESITFMSAPPLILQDLVERYEASPPTGHSLRKFYGGGGPVPPSLVRRADAVGIRAIRAFGMTETTGNITVCHTDEPFERRARFDGRAYHGSEIGIVDGNRQPLPVGSIGEIRVRGPLLLLRYTDPKVTAEAMDDAGWFYTGDLGRLDEDDWLVFEGRLKDIINRGGEKFSSQDIEAAIATFPGITDVAVVAAPHARFGEVPAAFIRLQPGVAWSGPDDVLVHLESGKLAKAKRPVEWYVMDEFPRTPSGKVQKQLLRKMLWDKLPVDR